MAAKSEAGAPKLSVEEVMRVVEGVQDWRELGWWLSIPYSKRGKPLMDVIIYWMETDPSPSWRRLIQALDGLKEKAIADHICHYAEPLTDSTLTVQNVTQALRGMVYNYAFSTNLGVPATILASIEDSFSTYDRQKQAVVDYYLRYVPGASWNYLTGSLYYIEHKESLQHVLRYVQRPTESTLTLTNLCNTLEEVKDWYYLGRRLNIPKSKRQAVAQQYPEPAEAKEEILRTFLAHHPAPSWATVSEALYIMGRRDEKYHHMLREVRRLYGTGRQLFDEAMKDGYVESLNIKVIFFGTAGAGKTCSKAVILGLPPPINRISTAMAERPVRVVCVDRKEDGEWLIMGPEEVREELAAAIRTATVTKVAEFNQGSVSSSALRPSTFWQRIRYRFSSSKRSTRSQSRQEPSPPSPTTAVKEEVTPNSSLPEASSTEDELVRLIDKAVVHSGSVARFKWVYFLDTGGQPQFHEVFRAFLKRASLCIFVQKLSERLDEYPLVEYYDENSKLVGKPYRTAVTHQQILNHCVQTMLSHDKVSAPKIVVVGTHVDKEDQCSETREAKNQKLIELLVPAFPDQVVYYGQDRKQMIFPLNARCPGEAERRVAKEIREVILNQCIREPDKIPLRWYALEQALQELARKYRRDILKKEECFAAALRLHFDAESFEAALRYLHDLNIIFYYHDILPEFVFCNPQVLLDKVTELVKCSHQLKKEPTEGVACSAEWGKFEAFGVVTVELLGRFCKHYIPGMFSPEHVIELFKYLLILADLNDTEYFMPSLLQTLEPCQLNERRASCVSACAPLVIFFPDGLPLGMLCSLVVFLLSQENRFPTAWKLEVEPTGNPTCLFRNCINFVIPGVPGSVTLFDCVKFFEIYACAPSELLPELCRLVRNAFFSGLESASIVLEYSDTKLLPAFICPCNKSSSHPATISRDQRWWICSRNANIHGKLQDKHRLWLPRKAQQMSGHELSRPDALEASMQQTASRTRGDVYDRVALNRDTIVRFLAANVSPGGLADKLLVAGLINDDIREKARVTGLSVSEMIRPMIDAVITRIELNAAKYDLFISVLRQFGSLEDLIQFIERSVQ